MKALVVYGTRWGGTIGVAERIGEEIRKAGFSVNVCDAKSKLPDVSKYNLIVVGSGIRADAWTKSALNFLDRNVETLRSKKTALFVSCQMADREEEAKQRAKKKYLFQVAKQFCLTPIAFGFFGGFVDFKKSHGIVVDVMVRVNRRRLLANGLDIRRVHDTRNWDCIGIWANEVAKAALEAY